MNLDERALRPLASWMTPFNRGWLLTARNREQQAGFRLVSDGVTPRSRPSLGRALDLLRTVPSGG
jgi:hypothetical protein